MPVCDRKEVVLSADKQEMQKKADALKASLIERGLMK